MMRIPPSATRPDAALQPAERAHLDSGMYRTPAHCDRGAEIAHRLEVAIERSKRIHAFSVDPRRQTQSQAHAAAIDRMCEAFAAVVDAKSPFTCSHSRGVAELAAALSVALRLAPDRVQLVRRAALLHDLGKLAVPNAILDKSSDLTRDEWEIVVQHPQLTREILARIEGFAELAEIAGAHHEKLDGTGYPRGLVASQLSIEARIIAVADIYQAMTEGRPYRPSMSHTEAMAVVTGMAPHKLDFSCVAALDSVHSAKPVKKHSMRVRASQGADFRQVAAASTARLRATA